MFEVESIFYISYRISFIWRIVYSLENIRVKSKDPSLTSYVFRVRLLILNLPEPLCDVLGMEPLDTCRENSRNSDSK